MGGQGMSDDYVPLKVVGWGPFSLPGEKKRRKRALEQARRMLQQAEDAQQRSQDNEPEET